MQISELYFRLREHHHSVSAAIRPTLCVVAADPRHTISRNPPVGNVGILLSARESVSMEPSKIICVNLFFELVFHEETVYTIPG